MYVASPPRSGDEFGAGYEVGGDCCRFAVARRVDPNDFVIGGEVRRERAPTVAVLREPVDQNESGARAVLVGMQVGRRLLVADCPHTCTKMGRWRTCP